MEEHGEITPKEAEAITGKSATRISKNLSENDHSKKRMWEGQMYQPIDQIQTGAKIKMMLKAAGYEVRDVQTYLHLSCPQPIYRWFKGKILPSVEHLCALGRLLNVHMEDLLVLQGQSIENNSVEIMDDTRIRRLLLYMKYLREVA